MAADKPPLELSVELVYADGSTRRLDSQQPAKDRPTGIRFRTARFDGFADASFALTRSIVLDYPDLQLLDGVNLIGADGAVAYEGRIATTPRNLAPQQGHQVTVQAAGWMTSAQDEPFVETYVDRDLSKWGDMSRQRRVNLLAANWSKLDSPSVIADNTGNPVVELAFADSWAAPYTPTCEAWWLPRPGITVGKVYYDLISSLSLNPTDPNLTVRAVISSDDLTTATTIGPNVTGGGAGYVTGTGTAVLLQLFYTGTPITAAASQIFNAHFALLAVYGNHAVPIQGPDPGGVYASDVITDICRRFCPKINPGLITPTTFAIPHLVFDSETKPYDAFLAVNAFHRFGLEVYENRTLRFAPVDLTDYDWEVRLSDPGTSVQLQGDDVARLANGVVVRYTDLNTGRETRLTPDTFTDLAATSSDNPANQAGIRLWTPLTLSSPTTQTAALQMGRAYLAEFNQVQAPGTLTVTGHVRDRAGHWQQGWKVRAGDTVAITDFANDRPRLITETNWDHMSKTLSISVESTFKRLDAVLNRIDVALQASGLSLPT